MHVTFIQCRATLRILSRSNKLLESLTIFVEYILVEINKLAYLTGCNIMLSEMVSFSL